MSPCKHTRNILLQINVTAKSIDNTCTGGILMGSKELIACLDRKNACKQKLGGMSSNKIHLAKNVLVLHI